MESVMRNKESTEALIALCNDFKERTGKEDIVLVEIGSYMGESSVIFAQQFPKGKIICIDPWISGYDENDSASCSNFNDVEFIFDLTTAKHSNITKIKGYSLDYIENCDICYLDGCHQYESVKKDIGHWLPQVKYAISGHDYVKDEAVLAIHPHIKGVGIAIDEILGEPDKVFGIDGNWIKYVNNE